MRTFSAGFRMAALSSLLAMSLPVWAGNEDDAYVRAVEDWRAEREANLKNDKGWLTVAGLFWLSEGEQTVGADSTNDFVLPEGSAPARVGWFSFKDRKTTFRAADGVQVTQNGIPVREVELEMGEDHALAINDLRMWLHYSGDRLAIRLRDLNSPLRKEFTGLQWYPVNPAYRVTGTFHAYPEPMTIEMVNILGDIEAFESPGQVEFMLKGEQFRVEPVSTAHGLWLVFRDETSGKGTYGAARFVTTDAPTKDGRVIIDFNKAYNPPCAFNPYTTCPLPVQQNRLAARIEAGEKDYESKPHS